MPLTVEGALPAQIPAKPARFNMWTYFGRPSSDAGMSAGFQNLW